MTLDEIDRRLCLSAVDAAPFDLIRLDPTKLWMQILNCKRKTKLTELDALLHTLVRLGKVVDLVRLSEELRELQADQRYVAKRDGN